MKNFVYFESTEGGMEVIEDIQGGNNLSTLRGWMSGKCSTDDIKILKWINTASIGEMCNHRLGYLVRLVDK